MKPREIWVSADTYCSYIISILTGLLFNQFHFCENETARSHSIVHSEKFSDLNKLFDKFLMIKGFVSKTIFVS